MGELSGGGSGEFEVANAAFLAQGLGAVLVATVRFLRWLYLALGLGEVDEVDLRLLVPAEGLGLVVLLAGVVGVGEGDVAVMGGEGDDVAGGLGQLEMGALA